MMTNSKDKTYTILKAFGGHAKGDEVTMNDRQAQFLIAGAQVELKTSKKPKGGVV